MNAKDWDNIAKTYHEHVVSPFQMGVRNPLFGKLDKITNKKSKVVADIGCGRGEILDLLAKRFRQVHAIDFSTQMLRIAKDQAVKTNITFHKKDMRRLKEFTNSFDITIAVNSILLPSIRDIKKALVSIHATLKKDGKFFGVFPSMGSILYQSFLILDDQINSGKNEERALTNTKRILERRKYDFIKGIYDDDGEQQKFYYDFELNIRLQEAGFRNIRLGKVLYPWGQGTTGYEPFPGKPNMWDWFVSAEK